MIGTAAPPIHVIGIDESGAAGLGSIEPALIERAELLCGGRRHLAWFPDAKGERVTIAGDLDSLYERIASSRAKRVVVLASGDPCFFGIGPLLAERFGPEEVIIHPRPSSVALAFSRLGMAWQDATIVSVHGRPIEAVLPAAFSARKLAILTDPDHDPGCVAEALLEAGLDDCPAYVCERLGGAAERIHKLRLASLPGGKFDPLNVLILLPTQPRSARAAFGRPDDDYISVRGQLTKAEVRAVTLTRLEPWRAASCWDVGAGAGSVAIEAAGLMPAGSVYAVERDPEQIAVLHENVRRHGAARVRVIIGTAPAALDGLPQPDAVFVGGGGSSLASILSCCAERLRPGGRLVANFTLLESLATWERFSVETGWTRDICQVSVARGAPLGGGTHLAPLAPVYVTRLIRPEAEP